MNAVEKVELNRRRARAGRIRAGIQSYIHTLGDVAAAYAERDWEVLGYNSWDAYVDEEFGASRLQLTPEHRQKAVVELRLAGLSQRAIGSALNVDAATVNRDLRGVASATPETAVGIDGKTYAATRPQEAPAPPLESAPPGVSAIATPAGEPDQPGEVAPKAEGAEAAASPSIEDRRANRRPLVDAFRDAGYDLMKHVERVERLALDDRFPRNAEQVARVIRGDLLRAADLLAAVIDRIPTLTKEPTE